MKKLALLSLFLLLAVASKAQAAATSPSQSLTASQLLKKPFLMAVEDVFEISGVGVVVTGTVERGTLKRGDAVEVLGLRPAPQKAGVRGIQKFRQIIEEVYPGDNVGVMLMGLKKADLERGMVLSKPGAVQALKDFDAKITLYTKEKGGRSTPVFNDYRPQFSIRHLDVSGVVKFPKGVESAKPGDSLSVRILLEQPTALEKGQSFVIREGGRTIGEGVVLKF